MTADDGLSIAYDVRGSGDVALAFVHCWACDRTYCDFGAVEIDGVGHFLQLEKPVEVNRRLGEAFGDILRGHLDETQPGTAE